VEDLSWRLTLSELSRRLDRHRRAAVAVLVGVAVLASLSAVTPKPRPTTLVWTAARDLAGGAPLQAADIALHPLPPTDVPAGALVGQRAPLGRVLAAPVRRGEPLTDVRLVGPALLAALGQDGDVAVPVRVADGAAAAALARAGDVVDVLVSSDRDGAADAARVVASAVTVLATPRADGTGGDAGLVVVAATAAQASTLAQAAVTGRLSLALRHA
jgi:Flp pilus assembly protein CpaB